MSEDIWICVINVDKDKSEEEIRNELGIPGNFPIEFGEPQPNQSGQQGLYVPEEYVESFDDLLQSGQINLAKFIPFFLAIVLFLAVFMSNC